jgi:hypothetical protein
MPRRVLPLPDEHGHRARPETATKHLVQFGEPEPQFGAGGEARFTDLTVRKKRFDPRPHFETAIGDLNGMQPANRRTAAELENAYVPERSQLGKFVGEMEYPVDHRVLRKKAARALGIGEQDDGAAQQLGHRLKFMEEGLEFAFRRRGLLR